MLLPLLELNSKVVRLQAFCRQLLVRHPPTPVTPDTPRGVSGSPKKRAYSELQERTLLQFVESQWSSLMAGVLDGNSTGAYRPRLRAMRERMHISSTLLMILTAAVEVCKINSEFIFKTIEVRKAAAANSILLGSNTNRKLTVLKRWRQRDLTNSAQEVGAV